MRCLAGISPLHLAHGVPPGGAFCTPELVLAHAPAGGLGALSRSLHRFWRRHLFRAHHADALPRARPTLVNNWEATYFDLSEERLLPLARRAAELGIQLFVLDDGWFGRKYPRTSDRQGLGDWVVNTDRFPDGLGAFARKVTALKLGSTEDTEDSEDKGKGKGEHMQFGLWVEPEMVSRRSALHDAHPDWVLRAPVGAPSEARHQLVLNLGLRAVQDHVIAALSAVLDSAPISYVKWDNNRGMHELPRPGAMHAYQLGLYRVLRTLVGRYPRVLWEGCASGGGRVDLALCAFFAQHWASDNTDALDRLGVLFGTSLVFPPAALGAHVSVVPNHQTGRSTPFAFRAHVALMAGSFGFELDVTTLADDEAKQVPHFVAMARELGPLVLTGDWYRLSNPWDSNWPAGMFLAPDGAHGAVFWFQVRDHTRGDVAPPLRLHGLQPDSEYRLDGKSYTGADLMYTGLSFREHGDYRSKVMRLRRV